jgi:hypothetical protein
MIFPRRTDELGNNPGANPNRVQTTFAEDVLVRYTISSESAERTEQSKF